MPYRIVMNWDCPDYMGEDAETRIEGVRKAVRSLADAEEAIAKYDGDINDYDVEWYGFGPDGEDELTILGWTWGDEEILQSLYDSMDPEWTADDVSEFLHAEVETPEQERRVFDEWDRRPKRDEDAQTLNRMRVNQAIGCVGAIHSMVYNPDDKRPVEPKLAELEALLRGIRV